MSTTLFLELFKVTLLAKAVVREEKGKGGPFLSLKMLLCSPKCHFFTFFHHAESCPSKKKEKKKKTETKIFTDQLIAMTKGRPLFPVFR